MLRGSPLHERHRKLDDAQSRKLYSTLHQKAVSLDQEEMWDMQALKVNAAIAPARPQTEATPNATEFTRQIVEDEAK